MILLNVSGAKDSILFNTGLPFFDQNDSPKNNCTISEPLEVEKTEYNENGYKVITSKEGVEVTYYSDGSILAKDYNGFFSKAGGSANKSANGWQVLGRLMIDPVGLCADVVYLFNIDVCRIALSLLGTSKVPNARYELTGRYIPGKIPGCEPSYSAPCNAGYWEYRITRI